jgi:hypothetical protein
MKQGKGEEYMILKKAAAKAKELVCKSLEKSNNLTWNEIIACWLTVAGVSSLVPSLFCSFATFVTTELSILFETRIIGSILLIIVAQLILLNENMKKNKKKEC